MELAAEVAALFDYLGKRSHRRPSEEPRVVLLEATDRLMDWLDPVLRQGREEDALEPRSRGAPERPRREGERRGGLRRRRLADGERHAGLDGRRRGPALVRGPAGGARCERAAGTVDEHLTLPATPRVYVLGDAGVYTDPRLGPLPPTASVAVQQGPWAARDLKRRLRGAGEQTRQAAFPLLRPRATW